MHIHDTYLSHLPPSAGELTHAAELVISLACNIATISKPNPRDHMLDGPRGEMGYRLLGTKPLSL